MKLLVTYILVAALNPSCQDNKSDSLNVPECIQNEINQIKEGEVWDPPAKVYRYTYNDQTVFYFPARCCDIPSRLLNENCEVICAPDGGFTGKGDGKCPDFTEKRKDEVLIWGDDRK